MNKFLKFGLLGLGGLLLFLATFVGVAALSGAPMHEVAVIGSLFPQPEENEELAGVEVTPEVKQGDPVENGKQAIERQAGVLGVFTMPSPFNAADLRSLETELRAKFRENRDVADSLRARELELDEWEKTLQEKYQELADLRTKLEELESSLELRFAELERDEAAKKSRELAGWKAMAAVYSSAEPKTAAVMLAEESPEDAATILRELDPKAASDILLLVQPAALRKQFMDEYRKANEAP